MAERIIVIAQKSTLKTKDGKSEYVCLHDVEGKAHNIFDNLKDKWDLCVEGQAIKLVKEQKGQYWNVVDVISVADALKPQENMGELKRPQVTDIAPQERGMWYKELGACIREKDIDTTTPEGKLLRSAYYVEMMRVLNIKLEKGEQ